MTQEVHDSPGNLIDLSTPRPASSTAAGDDLHSDFTPSLARALSSTFLQSAAAAREKSSPLSHSAETGYTRPASTPVGGPSPRKGPPGSLLRTALTNSVDENMLDYLLSTPTTSSNDEKTMMAKTCPQTQPTVSLRELDGGQAKKRPATSAPNTPRSCVKPGQRRRVLGELELDLGLEEETVNKEVFDNERGHRFLSAPLGRFESPKSRPASAASSNGGDSGREEKLWGVLDFEGASVSANTSIDIYADSSSDNDSEPEHDTHRQSSVLESEGQENEAPAPGTAESVVQLREAVNARLARQLRYPGASRGGKTKPGQPRPRIVPVEYSTDDEESSLDDHQDRTQTDDKDKNGKVVADDSANDTVAKLEMELVVERMYREYEKEMHAEEVRELKAVTAFVELERRFGVEVRVR